ncbi:MULTISPECIES: CAP domain-containing protein [unclassified Crossiella]|uniref:CAP domain-containing protein n=1 Tax=unclassified Crossiella TaxID=2620835 RepID=UPI0020003C0C|nr:MULTISPECIES: CAP domain-containing protein [unclassified Crossiella]MCK2238368.1 CAP domain-containing protein [Crossiella sp. S99.2]MCK2256408.1 CAP domain-containing protein [Crossiella sp. S99.1]
MTALERSRRWRRNRTIIAVLAAATVGVGVAAWLTTPEQQPLPVAALATLPPGIVDPGSGVGGPAPSASAGPSETGTTASSTSPTSLTSAKPSPTSVSPSSSPKPSPKPKPSSPAPSRTPNPPSGDAAEQSVRELVDAERGKAGCAALRWDDRLARAADKHSADMATNDYFSHTSQDGRSPSDRVKAEGYHGGAGENIAAGQTTPESVMKTWMNSPGHRANILNCDYKSLGVGLHRGGSYRFYWTQNFGLA